MPSSDSSRQAPSSATSRSSAIDSAGSLAPRPLRQDAARNRERVLLAAGQLVAEYGTDVSMEQIAEEAGVGIGTLYRRFPNKESLVDAVVDDVAEHLIDAGTALLDRGESTGLEDFLRATGQSLASQRGCLARLWRGPRATEHAVRVRRLVGELLAQAQSHGRIAPEVAIGDVLVLLWALPGIISTAGEVAPHAWERHLDIHLAGLRSPGLQSAVPPLSRRHIAALTGSVPAARRR